MVRKSAESIKAFEQLPRDSAVWLSFVTSSGSKLRNVNTFTDIGAREVQTVLEELRNPPSDSAALKALRERVLQLYRAGMQPVTVEQFQESHLRLQAFYECLVDRYGSLAATKPSSVLPSGDEIRQRIDEIEQRGLSEPGRAWTKAEWRELLKPYGVTQ